MTTDAHMLVPFDNPSTHDDSNSPYDKIQLTPYDINEKNQSPEFLDPTRQSCHELTVAYDYFNATLFKGQLHPCLITLQRHRGAAGYFAQRRFQTREGKVVIPELALNPDIFHCRTVEQILSTLVHEMVHALQFQEGEASPGGYHNKEFANFMEVVGLITSSTGTPGGKRTGQQMSHYIDPNGPFARECAVLMANGINISFIDRWAALRSGFIQPDAADGIGIDGGIDKRREAKLSSKTKFRCPKCSAAAWGKHTLQINCRPCGQPMRAANGRDPRQSMIISGDETHA